MATKGDELLVAIKSMRNFLGDVSKLLSTADGHMGEHGWESLWGGGCLKEMSGSVSAGHLWMPREAARVYKNNDAYPNVVAMIAVLIDDYQQEYKLTEPVVSGSYFVFPEGTHEKKINVDFWQCRWFGWCSPPLDGIPVSLDDKYEDWDPSYNWKYMQVFGRPLVNIINEALLREMIIDPLVRLIEEHME